MLDIKASQFPAGDTILKHCHREYYLRYFTNSSMAVMISPYNTSTFNDLPGFEVAGPKFDAVHSKPSSLIS
jgi:hypothetical protein